MKNTHKVNLKIPNHLRSFVLESMNPHRFIREMVNTDFKKPAQLTLLEKDKSAKLKLSVYFSDKEFAHINQHGKPAAFVIALIDFNFKQLEK